MSAAGVLDDVWTVYAKEMRSLARDRHTVIYSLFLPLFLYPALLLGTLQVVAFVKGMEERRTLRVGVEAGNAATEFVEKLRERQGIVVVPLPERPGSGGGEGGAGLPGGARLREAGEDVDAAVSFRRLAGAEPPAARLDARI